MDPLLIVFVVLLIGLIVSSRKEKSVDEVTSESPDPPSSAPETTDLSEAPPETTVLSKAPAETTVAVLDTSHVPEAVQLKDAKIELYTGKNFKGDKVTKYPGMKVQFAEMTSTKQLVWKYQSMKIVPGTYIMLTSSVSGSMDRGFAVGKYDVPDMFAFIKSYDSLYNQQGIYMDRNYWARPFFIHVLTNSAWDRERAAKYASCIKTTRAWKYSDAKGKEYCGFAEPERNMANITGFSNQY